MLAWLLGSYFSVGEDLGENHGQRVLEVLHCLREVTLRLHGLSSTAVVETSQVPAKNISIQNDSRESFDT